MVVLDGSAIFAILLDEPEASHCADVLGTEEDVLMSSGSLTEFLIVAARKDVLGLADEFIAALEPTIVPVTEDRARAVAKAYRQWGKGFHKAKLNFGDCFAYALAKEQDCPLLYIGNDFARTDIEAAIS